MVPGSYQDASKKDLRLGKLLEVKKGKQRMKPLRRKGTFSWSNLRLQGGDGYHSACAMLHDACGEAWLQVRAGFPLKKTRDTEIWRLLLQGTGSCDRCRRHGACRQCTRRHLPNQIHSVEV